MAHYKTKLSLKLYTFKTSNLHHRVLRVILHLVDLPLHQQTVVYTEPASAKIAFFAIRRTNSRIHELLAPFLYQSVPFITKQVCVLLLSPQSQELLSKATK